MTISVEVLIRAFQLLPKLPVDRRRIGFSNLEAREARQSGWLARSTVRNPRPGTTFDFFGLPVDPANSQAEHRHPPINVREDISAFTSTSTVLTVRDHAGLSPCITLMLNDFLKHSAMQAVLKSTRNGGDYATEVVSLSADLWQQTERKQ